MIREGLYRLLGRFQEQYAFFVPNYVRTLNWEVMPVGTRKLDSFDRWLVRSCPHGVSVRFEKSAAAEQWLNTEGTNFWGVHQGEGPGGPDKDFWTDTPQVRFYMRDSNMAFELKMKFG
jgi:hypothetical protein